jgi:hypothetical protein
MKKYVKKTKRISSVVDDKQADIFRDKALTAINEGHWEIALENLKSAYEIRPGGPFIRLQLVNALIHLERFSEVAEHLDFINNPPNSIANIPSLNGLINEVRLKMRKRNSSMRQKWIDEKTCKLNGIPIIVAHGKDADYCAWKRCRLFQNKNYC